MLTLATITIKQPSASGFGRVTIFNRQSSAEVPYCFFYCRSGRWLRDWSPDRQCYLWHRGIHVPVHVLWSYRGHPSHHSSHFYPQFKGRVSATETNHFSIAITCRTRIPVFGWFIIFERTRFHTSYYEIKHVNWSSDGIDFYQQCVNLQFQFEHDTLVTSRERPKLALYLRLKIVKGGPFGCCETPVHCKIWTVGRMCFAKNIPSWPKCGSVQFAHQAYGAVFGSSDTLTWICRS